MTPAVTCWADPLTRSERDRLARTLAAACHRFWDAADPCRYDVFSDADQIRRRSLRFASDEMAELRIDVTERAELATDDPRRAREA